MAGTWHKDVAWLLSEQLGLSLPRTYNRRRYLREDLGADDHDMVEIVLWIEEEIGAPVPDDAAECFLTTGDLIDYCQRAMPLHN